MGSAIGTLPVFGFHNYLTVFFQISACRQYYWAYHLFYNLNAITGIIVGISVTGNSRRLSIAN